MDDDNSSRRSSEGTSSEATLLDKERNDEAKFNTPTLQPFWRQYILPFFIHFIIFLTYSTLVLFVLNSRPRNVREARNLLYSPANEALHWEVQKFHLGDGTSGPYSGYPRPELEEAWDQLLGNMNIRISLEDLKAVGRAENAVELPDGSGYAGTLNIYHEIHCVKWLHTYMYQEHYYPNLDDAQREDNRLHSEHCLNQLRSTAMCHGDVGMVTYSWGNDSRKPKAAATAHQCIDFGRLTEWTNERTIDMFKPGFLVHPTLGSVYNEGEKKDPID